MTAEHRHQFDVVEEEANGFCEGECHDSPFEYDSEISTSSSSDSEMGQIEDNTDSDDEAVVPNDLHILAVAAECESPGLVKSFLVLLTNLHQMVHRCLSLTLFGKEKKLEVLSLLVLKQPPTTQFLGIVSHQRPAVQHYTCRTRLYTDST